MLVSFFIDLYCFLPIALFYLQYLYSFTIYYLMLLIIYLIQHFSFYILVLFYFYFISSLLSLWFLLLYLLCLNFNYLFYQYFRNEQPLIFLFIISFLPKCLFIDLPGQYIFQPITHILIPLTTLLAIMNSLSNKDFYPKNYHFNYLINLLFWLLILPLLNNADFNALINCFLIYFILKE